MYFAFPNDDLTHFIWFHNYLQVRKRIFSPIVLQSSEELQNMQLFWATVNVTHVDQTCGSLNMYTGKVLSSYTFTIYASYTLMIIF